ncbi:MAG: hypothetical protein C0413_02150 [Clostridiales bacterium]|nr:hypothetical protein [Clostridiales bacterium]
MRDGLAVTVQQIDVLGLTIFVMHVHDVAILYAPPERTLEEVCAIMELPIPWALGLLLNRTTLCLISTIKSKKKLLSRS